MTAERAAAWEAAADPMDLLRVAEAELQERDYRRVAAGWCELIRPLLRDAAYPALVDRVNRAAGGEPLGPNPHPPGYPSGRPERAVWAALFPSWPPNRYGTAADYYRGQLGPVSSNAMLPWALARAGPTPPDVHVGHPWHAAFSGVCVEARAALTQVVRCVLGNPFRPAAAFDPAWRSETVVVLARGMYDGRDFGPMPVLGDALDDAGCDHPDVLAHCRGPGPHVRGCWVVDAVLGPG